MQVEASKTILLFGFSLGLLMAAAVHSQELITNGQFLSGIDDWQLEFGMTFEHDINQGHETPGSARVNGSAGNMANILQCVDISTLSSENFAFSGCFRALNYEPTFLGFDIAFFGTVDCSSGHILSQQSLESVDGQHWHRISDSVTIPSGTMAIEILPVSIQMIPANGITLFDDISLRPLIFMDNFEDGTVDAWTDFF